MKRYSTATLVLLAIIFAGLTLCVSSRTIWADEEMITPQWVDDFAKGQTDAGKVPPEVKTQEKKKPIGGCTKTNKDGSQEWDVVYHHDKTGETTTIYYIKTKDKGGKPKTVWKIKVEKPGQPPRQPLTTRSPEIRPRPSKLTTRHRPARHTTPLRIIPLSTSATAGVTIGEPPLAEYPKKETGGGGGGTTERTGGGKPTKEYAGGGKGGGLRTETGGGGGTTTETGGGGGGKTTETGGGGGGGKTTREKVPPPKKPKEPPLNLKLVTYGGPPGETVIHLGEKPPTTPQEYVHKNPTPTWDHGDGGDPKVPVEPNHPHYGEIVQEPKIPHNDRPHVTETVKIPGETYTETTPDGWINIGSGWAYTRIPVRFVNDCVGQTQEKVTETTPTSGGGGTTTETTGGGNTEEPPSTQEVAKKLAKQKEALNPPPPPTQTKDDCGPWDGRYNPIGEGEAIKNARYDVALGEQRLTEATEWRSKDPDWCECAGYFLYDSLNGDPVRHAQDQLTRSKWQVEIYEAAYRAARARGVCNESAHFYGATALHNWIQEVRWDFIQRMTLWLQALGSAIMAQQVAQDIAANLGEISKAKDASAQKAAFDKSVERVKARMAAGESGGGGASSEGAGGAGRTGKGSTQVLGPGENPYAQEGGKGNTQKLGPGENPYAQEGGKGGTQKLGPGENPYAQESATKALPKDATEAYQKPGQPEYPQGEGESCPATQSKPSRQPGKTPVKTKTELNNLVRQQEAIKKKIDGRVAEIQKVQQEMNKEGLTPEQEKALTDKYWQLCEQNGKDFHDYIHYMDNYDIQSEPLTAGSLVPERP